MVIALRGVSSHGYSVNVSTHNNRDHRGDDDFFSSDLPVHIDDKSVSLHFFVSRYGPYRSLCIQSHRPLIETFGKLPSEVPMLFAFSGADEYFPFQHGVTPEGNFSKWQQAAAEGSGRDVDALEMEMTVVPGASHSVKQAEAQEVLMSKVADFVRRI